MPIGTLNPSRNKDIFYTSRYKTLVRSLKEILLEQAVLVPIPNPNDRFAYRNNFYKMLRELGVPFHMYWTIAYINGVENIFQDNSSIMEVYNIPESVVLGAISRSNTRQG